MALDYLQLSVLAYANGFTLWHYRTEDSASAVTQDGYFDGTAHILSVGDIIFANQDVSRTPNTAMYVVTSVGSADVQIASMSRQEDL